MAVAKEQIRQIISDNNLSSVGDMYALLKESFKDILQELRWMQHSAMKKIKRVIPRIQTKETDILPKH